MSDRLPIPTFLFPHGQLGVSLRVNKSMGHSARIRVFTLYNTLHAVLCTHLYFKISLWLYSHNTHCIPVQIVSIGMSMEPQCILFPWPLKQSTCLGKSVSVDLLNWGGYRVCCCLLQTGTTSPQLLFSGVWKSCNSKWSEFKTMECGCFHRDHLLQLVLSYKVLWTGYH